MSRRICLFILFLMFLGIRFYRWLLKSCRRLVPYLGQTMLSIVCLIFLAVGVVAGWEWYYFPNTPFNTQNVATTIIVKPHFTLKQVANQLHEQGLLAHPRFFVLFARREGYSHKIRVGEYAIDPQTTPRELLDNIVNGKVVMRKLTLVEGVTMRQIRQMLASDDALQHIAVNQTDQEIMASLGHPGESSEGRFFPDTYIYTWGNKDTLILQQAYQRMAALINQEWPTRQSGLPYATPDQALIVASLVESEAVLPAERPIIAGVILRRLQQNMNLQVDPTVTYGVGKPYGSVITLEDLRNDNPYNTYLHKGLPPTPINMPSAASIYAALHPAGGNALYYVAQGDGSHHFSATYTEHLQAVQKYRQYKKSEVDDQRWLGLGLFLVRSSGFY